MYNEVENNARDVYPCNTIAAKTVGQKHDKPDYNMQMVCHIKENKDINRGKLIDIGFLNPLVEMQQNDWECDKKCMGQIRLLVKKPSSFDKLKPTKGTNFWLCNILRN